MLYSVAIYKPYYIGCTMSSTIVRLAKKGYIIRSDKYKMEDPFLQKWIVKNMIQQ